MMKMNAKQTSHLAMKSTPEKARELVIAAMNAITAQLIIFDIGPALWATTVFSMLSLPKGFCLKTLKGF